MKTQTSTHACKVAAKSKISERTARRLGFAVDSHLALLGTTHHAPFHHGNFVCSEGNVPSADGELSIRADVQHLELQDRVPTSDLVPPSSCQDFLVYRTQVELGTNEGTVAARFAAEAYAEGDVLYVFAQPDPSAFSGALGVRVDPARPRTGVITVDAALTPSGMYGQLFTLVEYEDCLEPTQHQGDGLFWPPNDTSRAHCGWLEVPSTEYPMISVDTYNTL